LGWLICQPFLFDDGLQGIDTEDRVRPISDTLLDELTQKLVPEFQPEQVILFGLHAWGTPDKSSWG
jgi:hypothetical protein